MKPTVKTDKYELWHGDCLEIMPLLAARSVDAVIADPPYGKTMCEWDTVIPFDLMWNGIWSACAEKPNILMFSNQPFTTDLISSQRDRFRYETIWEKNLVTGFLNANVMPLRAHESIIIFGNGHGTYNPQKSLRTSGKSGNKTKPRTDVYGKYSFHVVDRQSDYVMPRDVVHFKAIHGTEKRWHPTQKPVALMEYLVKTYTNETETVLDFTMGSGSTGVAAIQNNRYFIGIEKDEKYFEVAKDRMAKTVESMQHELQLA